MGVACGDDTEGSDGVLLVANLETSERKFRVAVGWGARRAHDAQEADGVEPEDTVLPNVDFSNLDPKHQKAFGTLDSRFKVSSYQRLRQTEAEERNQLRAASPVVVPGILTHVPAAKPFADDD